MSKTVNIIKKSKKIILFFKGFMMPFIKALSTKLLKWKSKTKTVFGIDVPLKTPLHGI